MQGLNLQWCKNPDKGLPKPDLVIYIDLTVDELMKRAGFGGEIYEKPEFQQEVGKAYEAIFEPAYWKRIDGRKKLDEIHEEAIKVSKELTVPSEIATLF